MFRIATICPPYLVLHKYVVEHGMRKPHVTQIIRHFADYAVIRIISQAHSIMTAASHDAASTHATKYRAWHDSWIEYYYN